MTWEGPIWKKEKDLQEGGKNGNEEEQIRRNIGEELYEALK